MRGFVPALYIYLVRIKGLSFYYHDSKCLEGSSTVLWIKPNLRFGACKKVTANFHDGARYFLTLLTTLT